MQLQFDLLDRTDPLLLLAILDVPIGLPAELNSVSLFEDEGEVIVDELSSVVVEVFIPGGFF